MTMAVTNDDYGRWIVACGFGSFAIIAFATALFPHWKVNWGGHGSRSKIPMSVRGRIAFGSFFAWAAVLSALPFSKTLGYFGMAVGVLLLIAAGFVGYQDKRNYLNSTKSPDGTEK